MMAACSAARASDEREEARRDGAAPRLARRTLCSRDALSRRDLARDGGDCASVEAIALTAPALRSEGPGLLELRCTGLRRDAPLRDARSPQRRLDAWVAHVVFV